jgi:hypothetical protein
MTSAQLSWHFAKTVALVLSPFVSGLVAAFAVHFLTQSRESEKWILDCKKQEFRELLSSLSDAYIALVKMLLPLVPLDGSDERRLREIQADSVRMIRDRIFIAKEIPPNEISNRWLRAMQRYETTLSPQNLHDEYEQIRGQIVTAALRCIPKSSSERLKFWKG